MLIFETIAEEKIREAIERGEFDDLPGQGQPLDLSDDLLVPEDLRMAYRILRNAGFLPPELEAHKEIHELEQLLHALDAGPERSKALQKMHLLNTKLASSRRGNKDLRVEAKYYDQLVERLSRS